MSSAGQQVQKAVRAGQRLRWLNVFITETFDQATRQADLLQKNGALPESLGALTGWPVAVKDCFCTRGVRTTLGSLMLANYTPCYNATIVDRLLSSGAILVGKTNMDEFSMGASSTKGHFGPVKNPWTLTTTCAENDDFHIAGGSSGGSAAAVACGMARLALGSDTGGSVRNPAALCGVVGLKPTYGLLSRHGMVPLVNSFDTPGILCKGAEDASLVLETLAGHDPMDCTSCNCQIARRHQVEEVPKRKLRVGLPKEFYPASLQEDVLKHWKAIAALLEKEAGCKLIEVSLPTTWLSLVCYHVLGEADVASNMARYDGIEYGHRLARGESFNNLLADIRQSALNQVVRRRILAGNYFLLKRNYDKYYVKAAKVRRLIVDEYRRVFREVDLLLTPVTSGDAPLYSQYSIEDNGYERERQDDYFTQPANLAGIPALAFPAGLSGRNLPVGLQLMANHFQDSLLLATCQWLEKRIAFPALRVENLIDQLETKKGYG